VYSALPGISPATFTSTVGTRVTASLLSFGVGVVTARGLGPHGRATLAVMIAVPTLFRVVAVFGLDNANTRFAGWSHSAFRQLVRWAVAFSAVAGTAIAAAWWFTGLHWPVALLGLSPRLALETAALCPIGLLATLLGTAEIGRGRVSVYNLATAVTAVGYLVGVVAILVAGHVTVTDCFAAYAGSQLVGVVLLLALAAVRVHPDGDRVPPRRYVSYALRAYLPNLGFYGMLRMDIPVIQIMAGTAAVALYAVALPLAESLLLIPAAVALVIFPQVTSGKVNKQAANQIGRTVTGITAVLAALLGLAAPVLIPVVYGVPYRGAVAVVWCMLPGMVLFSAGRTRQAYFAATDLLRPAILATGAGAVVGLICLAALTTRLGAVGAGVADSASYLAFTAVLMGGVASKGQLMRRINAWLWRCWQQALLMRDALAAHGTRVVAAGCGAAAAGVAAGLIADRSTVRMVTVVGLLLLLVTVAVPDIGLYLLAVVSPVSQASFGAAVITDKEIAVLIGACLAGRLAARRLARRKYRSVLLALSVVGYFLVSATEAGGGGSNARSVLLLGVPLLGVPLIADGDRVTRRAIMLFAFTSACLAVPEILTARASLAGSSDISAVQSAMVAAGQTGAVNHNSQGALFVIGMAVLLAALPRCRDRGARIAVLAAIVLLAVGVAFSFSRASYFGGIAVIVGYAARRSVKGLAGVAAGCGCLVPFLPAAVAARLGSVWSSSGLDTDSAVRLDLWSSALRMFDAHPLFGVGFLNFSNQLPAYFTSSGNYDSFLVQLSLVDFAHNMFLTVIAETGLIGGVLVLALGVAGWRRSWRAMRASDWAGEAAVLALIGVATCSAFGEVLFVPAILAAFLMVMLSAAGAR
jgi:O-antigen/teichoic acid export membrane protein/O-antigen ligase